MAGFISHYEGNLPMTKALEIVQQFYAAVGAGDMQKAASLMAPDIRWMEAENRRAQRS